MRVESLSYACNDFQFDVVPYRSCLIENVAKEVGELQIIRGLHIMCKHSVAALSIAHDTPNGNCTRVWFVQRKGAKKSTSERLTKRIVNPMKKLTHRNSIICSNK